MMRHIAKRYIVSLGMLFGAILAISPQLGFGEGTVPGWYAPSDADSRSLQERVRALQKDVFQLSEDLNNLQGELLTPDSTSFVVLVSADTKSLGSSFALDSVQMEIDQKPLAKYLYSAREQSALMKGGVQRLYAGNITVGRHKLNASYLGKDAKGKDQSGNISVDFDKGKSSKFIELRLMSSEKDTPRLMVKEWE